MAIQAKESRAAPTARTATLIAASVGFGVIQLDVTVVNVAVKPIGEALGGGTAALQWVVSSYTLILRCSAVGRLRARPCSASWSTSASTA